MSKKKNKQPKRRNPFYLDMMGRKGGAMSDDKKQANKDKARKKVDIKEEGY